MAYLRRVGKSRISSRLPIEIYWEHLVEQLVILTNKYTQQRRSQRIMPAIPILVSSTGGDDSRFSEEAHTVTVNAHGALILLAEKVKPGQLMTVRHLKAGEDRECTVVDVGANHDTTPGAKSVMNCLILHRDSGM
jgi:hypothetical protein